MPKHDIIISSPESLSKLIGKLRLTFRDKGAFRVKIDTDKSRSLSQNALLHKWCAIVAMERGEGTMKDIKNHVKLHFFAPILIADSDEFCEAMALMVRGLSEAEQLKAIEFVDVTSACTTAQMSLGLENMANYYASLDVDPVELEFVNN